MSYILFFWKEHPGAVIDPEKLIEELQDGAAYPGVQYVPFEQVQSAFHQEFPEVRDLGLSLAWEYFDSRFEVVPLFKSAGLVSLVQVYCAKCGVTVERVRSVAAALGARVYDPQWADSLRAMALP